MELFIDAFYFDFTELGDCKPTEVTKRSILQLTARVFDPLGFVSPFVIQFKTLFRDLCLSQMDWDLPLSGKLLLRWKKIISELDCLNGITVPRCYFKFDSHWHTVQVHGFSDASERAFAAVV